MKWPKAGSRWSLDAESRRKGELRFPQSQLDWPANKNSGANFEVSPADFSELEIQLADSLAFFTKYDNFVRRLKSFPGVDAVVVDFGAEIHPPGWCWFSFPPELLAKIGSLGVTLMLSVYPVADEIESQ